MMTTIVITITTIMVRVVCHILYRLFVIHIDLIYLTFLHVGDDDEDDDFTRKLESKIGKSYIYLHILYS